MIKFDGIADGMANLFDREFLDTVTAERADDGIIFDAKCLSYNEYQASNIAYLCLTV